MYLAPPLTNDTQLERESQASAVHMVKTGKLYRPTYCYFTQVVCCKTQQIGARIAAGRNGIFIAFKYLPADNVPGGLETNILPI